jgi:hypothetical protein
MFIVVCFSRETRNTTATSEQASTLEKRSRLDRSVTKEAIPAVTATANQKRTAIGSVQNNKTKVTPSGASALAIAATRCVVAPGMGSPLAPAPDFPRRPERHITVM